MSKFLGLCVVACADVARTVIVLDAVLVAERASNSDWWLSIGLLLASGGLSLALIGLAMRAHFGFATPANDVRT